MTAKKKIHASALTLLTTLRRCHHPECEHQMYFESMNLKTMTNEQMKIDEVDSNIVNENNEIKIVKVMKAYDHNIL